MRILNEDLDKSLDRVSIFLTKQDALQLKSYLNQLLNDPKLHHVHLTSEDYQKEITVSIYDEENLQDFHPRAVKLIKEDV